MGPASFYKVVTKPGEAASTLSQVFLGVRIACAECHHHPYDRWSQNDYYGMQAFFTGVGRPSPGRGVSCWSPTACRMAQDPRTRRSGPRPCPGRDDARSETVAVTTATHGRPSPTG